MQTFDKIYPVGNEEKLTDDVQVFYSRSLISYNKIKFLSGKIPNSLKIISILQEFLDSALQGAIYVRIGTHLPSQMQNELIEAFRHVNQRIIWEHESLPSCDSNSNLHFCKNSASRLILSHKNTSLLITQDDTVVINQALHYGIPMLITQFKYDEVTKTLSQMKMLCTIELKNE